MQLRKYQKQFLLRAVWHAVAWQSSTSDEDNGSSANPGVYAAFVGDIYANVTVTSTAPTTLWNSIFSAGGRVFACAREQCPGYHCTRTPLPDQHAYRLL